jgi:hypothetical protein
MLLIFLLLILYLLYELNKTKVNDDTKEEIVIKSDPINNIIIPPIVHENKISLDKYIVDKYNNPTFRGLEIENNFGLGLIENYKLPMERESGGSKIYKHMMLDHKNMKINVTDYKNYNSYRIKPIDKNNIIEKNIQSLHMD